MLICYIEKLNTLIDNDKEKLGRAIGGILLVLILFFSVAIYTSQDVWEKIDEDWAYEVPAGMRCWIDYVEEENNRILIEGYAFVHGENLNVVKYGVVLFDTLADEYYLINTSVNDLGDLSSYFDEGFDYDEGRFLASVFTKHLKPNHEYKVCVLYQSNGYNVLLDTQRSIMLYE